MQKYVHNKISTKRYLFCYALVRAQSLCSHLRYIKDKKPRSLVAIWRYMGRYIITYYQAYLWGNVVIGDVVLL